METLKKILGILKLLFEHKAMIVWVIGLCGGVLVQCSEIREKEQEIKDTQQQVTNVANHVMQHESQAHPPVNHKCSCDRVIKEHVKRYH